MRTLILLVVISSAAALAEETLDSAPGSQSLPSVELSLKAGGHFPQVVNALDTSFDGILKLGYAPFAGRQLQLFADVGYSQPAHKLSSSDPRLSTSGAEYSSTLVVKDLATTVGLSYFILPPDQFLVPYVGAGARVHFLRSEVEGSADSAFGEHVEMDSQLGGVGFAGVGLRLGPGLLLGELAMGYAPVDQRVTGTSNIGALSALLGYGLMF